jgi:hypothetical protein
MNKRRGIEEFTNILTKALRHKIGSIIMKDELYAPKYAKDYEILFAESKKVLIKFNYNLKDKKQIKEILSSKLKKELEEKDFIDDEKFNIMDDEMNKALSELGLI